METITRTELNAILTKAAKSDMRIARKSGEMLIAQTKVGNITLRYHTDPRANRGYSAITREESTPIMDAAEMVAFLSTKYDVALENTTVVEG